MAKIKKYKSTFFTLILFLIALYLPALSSPIDSMFADGAKSTFYPIISDAYGVSFRDINNDTYPDLYIVCFRNLNRFLINNPNNKTFEDFTITSGLGGNLMPGKLSNLELGTVVADFNNDKNIEVLISGWNNTTKFYTNQGNLDFRRYLYNLKIIGPHDFNGAITGDVDNDGDLDLFFTDEHYSNRLFINRGNAVFDDETFERGLTFNAISQGAGFSDIDNDGDLDLYVTNWYNFDLFYQNDGNGNFVQVKLELDVFNKKINTNSVSFSDIDNDGDTDFFVTGKDSRNFLYVNNTATGDSIWDFIDATIQYQLSDTSTSYGSVIADFNNDGWQDIFVTNVGPNQFYLNNKNNTFKKVFEENPPHSRKTKGYSTGSAFADYDLDGDLDLFVSNKDTFCLLYDNPINDSSFIQFRVHGIKSNRDAIGSRVEIYQNNHLDDKIYLLGTREISGGSGYLSLNDLVVHFGLDTISKVDAKIIFPSKKIITLTSLSRGYVYDVFEYSDLVSSLILSYNYLIFLFLQMEFWYYLLLTSLFIYITVIYIRLGLKRYKWSPVIATGSVSGYFFVAIIIIFILNQVRTIYILLAINFVSILYILLFVLYSERIHKLYISRKKYRSVLIDLTNQILKIRDDKKLINTVIESINKNSNFDKVCLVLFDQDKNSISIIVCEGITAETQKLNHILNKYFKSLKDPNEKLFERVANEIVTEIKADISFPIFHENRFYGILILGTSKMKYSLNDEDIELYSSLTNQIAITLENNEYIRNSNEMIKELTESKVKEEYLKKLEESNTKLDSKNKELQKLYDELKNTQSQLIQSEKMSSLGQLVAGISHELNNPIGFIYSNSNQLQKYIARVEQTIQESKNDNTAFIENVKKVMPDVKSLIEDTLSGSKIVKELIDNLRRFSHLDQAKKQNVDIHEGIESSLKILHSQLKNRIELHKNFQATQKVECNPGQINQVLLNILSNAAQSIEDEGHIWIDTGIENDYLFVKIKDDGKGINKEYQKNIFDPFFTTKPVGEGTGLGLSISYSIIKNHSGTIEVESEPNNGATFSVLLPLK